MFFKDIVSIKQSFCCDKCSSFEYDLPCRINSDLIEGMALSFGAQGSLSSALTLFKSNMLVKIGKDENTKIEVRANTRLLKLCVPKDDINWKNTIEEKLAQWISDTLEIEIEL
jgi:hypothetical protein